LVAGLDDARDRGWDSEVARHARVIASLQRHLDALAESPPQPASVKIEEPSYPRI